MNRTLSTLPERALQLATQVVDGIRNKVPDRAIQWIETGAALGVLKTGSRFATRFVRRNPVIAVAAAAGAGLLLYAARRRAKQTANGAIEGRSTRIEAKRSNGSSSTSGAAKTTGKTAKRKTTARKTSQSAGV